MLHSIFLLLVYMHENAKIMSSNHIDLYIGLFLLCRLTYVENMQINNAGSNAYSFKPLAEASDEDLM